MLGSARSVLLKKSQPQIPGLIASYSFDAGSGGTVTDNSGNGHTLTIVNSTWGTGHTSNGLVSSNVVTLGASASFAGPTAAVTLMAWCKATDLTANTTRPLLGFFDSSNSNSEVAVWAQRNSFGTANLLQVNCRINGGLGQLYGGAMTLNTWTHIAVTYDGSTNILYVNGSSAASNVVSGPISASDSLWIGGANTGNSYCMIDDVRAYNVALTAGQITSLMNTPV